VTSSSAQPTNQRPNSATTAPARSTTLLSPYHQCFRLGVQSYTPAPIRPTSGPGPRIQERLHGLRRDQIHLLNVRSRALRNPFRRPFADPPQTLHHQSMGGPEATTAATPWPSNTGSTRLRSQPNYPPPHGEQAMSADDSSADFSPPYRPTRPPSLLPGGLVPRTIHHQLAPRPIWAASHS
jgi:hypothetical protein